ncbi:SURF1 family protein [Aquabacter cavernae]|uniref:SURF1 family protein n=1 Tax=Aquabacter cavernae TaxID=2496029 RepID=UPI000F8F572D|nr:SURF1 family protein [Aquabacter cavernae]
MPDGGGGHASPAPEPKGAAGLKGAAVFALLLLILSGVFCALGAWQVQRLAWKHDLIARVEARVTAPPVPAPGPGQWGAIDAASSEYQRVRTAGHFLNDNETLVQAVSAHGAGYWVLTPFRTDAGFTVLVNRGFVPHDNRTRAARQAGEIAGETIVTGLLRLPEPKGGFLRDNDPAADRWYSRDVSAIAAARDLGPVAPYFIDADATPNAGGLPMGGLTVISFPNNHLGYALTWFAMAAMAVGGAVLVWRRRV